MLTFKAESLLGASGPCCEAMEGRKQRAALKRWHVEQAKDGDGLGLKVLAWLGYEAAEARAGPASCLRVSCGTMVSVELCSLMAEGDTLRLHAVPPHDRRECFPTAVGMPHHIATSIPIDSRQLARC